MSVTYNITTNFAAKDTLPTDDPAKVIRGTYFSTEFLAIKAAFTECATSESPTFTGTVTAPQFSGSLTGNVTGDVTGDLTGNVTGDVTGNVTGDVTGNLTGDVTGNVTGDIIGGASSAAKWTTPRTITLSGDATGSVSLDGSADVGIDVTVTGAGDDSTLGGIPASGYLRSDAADVKTSGTLRFNDNIICSFGTGNDAELFCNGSHMYMDLNSGIGNFYIRDGSTTRFTFDDAGSFTATGNISAYSDIKLKDNIEVITDALSKVEALSGCTYNRNDMDDEKQAGLIAQEIQAVLPEAVRDVDGTLTVNYNSVIALLVEAVKELGGK